MGIESPLSWEILIILLWFVMLNATAGIFCGAGRENKTIARMANARTKIEIRTSDPTISAAAFS
jgi:hypothetical protein